MLERIALQPRAPYFGPWESPATAASNIRTNIANQQAGDQSKIAQISFFAIWPHGETSQTLTAADESNYYQWIDAAVGAIGNSKVAVILNIDLAVAYGSNWQPSLRAKMTKYAAQKLGALPNVTTYVDAGDSDWLAPDVQARALSESGVQYVRGFAIGATHYASVGDGLTYGAKIVNYLKSWGLGVKHFVIDTADNGKPFTWLQFRDAHPGAWFDDAQPCTSTNKVACTSLGIPPTTNVTDARLGLTDAQASYAASYADGYLWFGRPWLYAQNDPFQTSKAVGVAASSPYFSPYFAHYYQLNVDRAGGSTRYDTANSVSNLAGYHETVYLASGSDFPDGLSAGVPAAIEKGVVLLSPNDSIPTSVQAQIRKLAPKKIVVVGGSGVLSDTVLNQAKALVPNTVRIGEATRYETNHALVSNIYPKGNKPAKVYIASGVTFPDALSAAPAAIADGLSPLVLVDGSASVLDTASRNFLASLGAQSYVIVGGTGAVSTGVQNDLSQLAPVSRIGGTNRYETSLKVNQAVFQNASHVYFANGLSYPDALSIGPVAGQTRSPVQLVSPSCVWAGALAQMQAWKTSHITLAGGVGVLTTAVARLTQC